LEGSNSTDPPPSALAHRSIAEQPILPMRL